MYHFSTILFLLPRGVLKERIKRASNASDEARKHYLFLQFDATDDLGA